MAASRELPKVLRRMISRGELVAGTYRVGGVLGAGGMGCVYEAEDIRLVRQVALKVADEPHVASLVSEAHALAAIRHPGVVAVHALDYHRGAPVIVMERLQGHSLQRRLDLLRGKRERLSIEEAVEILFGIAGALSAVHRAGIAHRDLKPGNVVLAGERIVLVDFGLFVAESGIGAQGVVAGSGEFIAPEVIARRVVPGCGPLVDLYALGIVAYELLTGVTPFAAPTFERMMRRHLEETAPPVDGRRRDVPAPLARLVDELLRKDPRERPASAEQVLRVLGSLRSYDAAARGLRLLVVDSDPATASTLRRALRVSMPQIVIETETDGARALEEIDRTPPDLVLFELSNPRLNGIELAMSVAAAPKDRRPRMIAMSNLASASDVALVGRLGAEAFLPKDERLVARLSALLGPLRLRSAPLAPSVARSSQRAFT
jgi:serine/threonine-protein kinase